MSNYCPRIFHGLTLQNISDKSVSYSACCWTTHTIASESINFNHKSLQEIRALNQQEILPPKYCSSCIVNNETSMRSGYLQIHGPVTYDHSLQYLDINIDYTCNLACVTCGPEYSTTWRKELKLKHMNVRPHLDQFFRNKIESLDLSQLKEIRIWGGEPFLTNTHKQILEYVVEHGNPQNIRLMYNTNGTRLIDPYTKSLIEKFKFARISFSVDGVDAEFEYLRYPAKWQEVEQNLLWWKDNLPHNSMLSLTVTASLLNVLSLNKVFEWHQKNFSKSCYGDDIEIYVHQAFGTFGLESMPPAMITHLKSLSDYCVPWIQTTNILGTKPHMLSMAVTKLHDMDQRRNLFLSDVIPQVAEFIGYQR